MGSCQQETFLRGRGETTRGQTGKKPHERKNLKEQAPTFIARETNIFIARLLVHTVLTSKGKGVEGKGKAPERTQKK